MLKQEMIINLNEQLNLECFSANLYLKKSAWCYNHGFEGSGQFFQSQSRKEIDHMHRFFDYLNNIRITPILETIKIPSIDTSSLNMIIHHAYEHECMVTQKINKLVSLSLSFQDYCTFHFLQWYIAEQYEEEKTFRLILDKFSLVSVDGNGLFFLDQDLKKMK